MSFPANTIWRKFVGRLAVSLLVWSSLIMPAFAQSRAAGAPLVDYVTYLGGSYADGVAGIAVNSTGSAYVAGTTSSPDFPVTSISLGTPTTSGGCAFVTKFNPSGTAIEFSVCLAASRATAFALDASGNLYLAVEKSATPGPVSFAVVKLDPTAQSILYTTTIGGAAESMAVDSAGGIYVAGAAGPGLATTPGAFQSQYAGGQCPGALLREQQCPNAFITKLSPSGSVVWTTYLGGSGPDDAHAIAVDSAGNVWVAGETVSPNFPTTAGAISRTFHGEINIGPLRYGDAFAAKLDASSRLLYSTYLGGPSLASVLNAATLAPGYGSAFATGAGAIATGEIVTLFGDGFGSSNPAVSFGQFPAAVLSASNCQINAVVPFEVIPALAIPVTVQSGGQILGPVKLPVVVSAPGIFAVNGSGSGQAAILNEDSTVNSPFNPAARGSIVSVYMTGVGSLNPRIADGSLGPLIFPFPAPVAGIGVTIGSLAAPVMFAGQAPGLIAGATQVNVQIPQNAPVGAAIRIIIYAAGYNTQLGQITMAVQ